MACVWGGLCAGESMVRAARSAGGAEELATIEMVYGALRAIGLHTVGVAHAGGPVRWNSGIERIAGGI